jgi:hypothetical protein
MRHLLLPAVLLLGASCALAQSTPSQTPDPSTPSQSSTDSTSPGQATPDQSSPAQAAPSQTPDDMSQTSSGANNMVQGCLSGTDGNYMLTDKNGNTYKLTGDSAKLSEHVGHEVQVSGNTTGGSTTPSASGSSSDSTGAGGSQTIAVTAIKHVSKTCQSASSNMSH